MMSAVGNQSDVESIRSAAIDVAHTEGFSRSTDDVTIQRMISFRISPAIKKNLQRPVRSAGRLQRPVRRTGQGRRTVIT